MIILFNFHILGGILYNYVNRQLSLIAFMIVMGVCGVGLPYSPNIAVLFMLAFIAGYCAGGSLILLKYKISYLFI